MIKLKKKGNLPWIKMMEKMGSKESITKSYSTQNLDAKNLTQKKLLGGV